MDDIRVRPAVPQDVPGIRWLIQVKEHGVDQEHIIMSSFLKSSLCSELLVLLCTHLHMNPTVLVYHLLCHCCLPLATV